MRAFFQYFASWLRSSSRPALFLTLFFVASLVAANYTIGIEQRIRALPWYFALAGFFLFFSIVITLVWGLQYEWGWKERSETPVAAVRGGRLRVETKAQPQTYFKPGMGLLLALPALFFSVKMVHWDLQPLLPRNVVYPWNRYTLLVIQLPLKLLLLLGFLFALWKRGLLGEDDFAASVGLTGRGLRLLPYFGLLLALVPLVVLASTQHDFLAVYPKVKNLAFLDPYVHPAWPWKLLYELSYGLDFLAIELFFRGLLVIALMRYAGTGTSSGLLRHGPPRSQPSPEDHGPSPGSVVLPMAAFYCTIHFGKPMGECITAFFGGLALGVLAARTRTIYGGLIVHLGLAWLMELGGWLGHMWIR
jgi:hypothetical protein